MSHASRAINLLIGAFIGLILVFIACGIGWATGTLIESRWFPHTDVKFVAGSITRNDGHVCWDYRYRKLRTGDPIYFQFIVTHRGDKLPVTVYKRDTGAFTSTYGFAHHEVGDVWTSTYCTDLPRAIDENEAIGIEGKGYYHGFGNFWDVVIDLPAFTVMPTGQHPHAHLSDRFAPGAVKPASVALVPQ